MNPEPIILVFEGASINSLNAIHDELHKIFKGTKYEDHYFITDRMVRGVENPYIDKLDEIIAELKNIKKNLRKAKEALND